MRRYTARLQVGDGPDANAIRRAIDRELSRATLTYRLGAVAVTAPGVALAEVASDADRDTIARLLGALAARLPLRVETVGWGWLLTGDRPPDATGGLQSTDDPYADATPQPEPSRTYSYGGKPLLRLGAAAAPVALLLFSLYVESNALGVSIWVLAILLYSLLGLRPELAPFRYVSWVHCDRQGIAAKYWWSAAPRRLAWGEVTALDLDLSRMVAVVRSARSSLRLPVDSFTSPSEKGALLKTIQARAGLHFVEVVPFTSATYRRFDAPD